MMMMREERKKVGVVQAIQTVNIRGERASVGFEKKRKVSCAMVQLEKVCVCINK